MIDHFWLRGLSAPKSFTCRTIDEKENIFWATCNWTDDRYKAFFNWAKSTPGFWSDSLWIVRIKHDGLYSDGTPQHPIVLTVREEKSSLKKRGNDVYD